ncbi:DMP19 family protein [Niabella hirudinis]|uniref:DMP19 family protein n=1 Tax=Niabella hirudinis TaxID=1285929 RepID=UPI003EBEF73A
MLQTTFKTQYNLLTYAAYTRLKSADNNWAALSRNDQELAALWILERDMHNGGFLRFIGSEDEQCLSCAIRALKKVNAKECLSALAKLSAIIESLRNLHLHLPASEVFAYLTDEERETIDLQNLLYLNNSDHLNEQIFKEYGSNNNQRRASLFW